MAKATNYISQNPDAQHPERNVDNRTISSLQIVVYWDPCYSKAIER